MRRLRRLLGRRRLDDSQHGLDRRRLSCSGSAPVALPPRRRLCPAPPRDQPADPWGANSLEWATTSPPPHHNFPAIPPIRSERPVFDARVAAVRGAERVSRLPFADQPQETRFFLLIAGWAGALGVIYWFVSYEVAGTVLLAGLALATGALSVWLMRSQRLRRRRAEAGAPEPSTGRSWTRRDASLLRRSRRSRSASGSRSLRSDPCSGSPRSPWARCRSCGAPARGSVRRAKSSTRRNGTVEAGPPLSSPPSLVSRYESGEHEQFASSGSSGSGVPGDLAAGSGRRPRMSRNRLSTDAVICHGSPTGRHTS